MPEKENGTGRKRGGKQGGRNRHKEETGTRKKPAQVCSLVRAVAQLLPEIEGMPVMSIQIPVDAPTNCLAANESFEKARLVYDREGEPDVNEVLLDIATGLHHLAQAMAVKCHEIAVAIEA